MENQNVVKVGDNVILKKGKNMKVFKVIKKQKVFLEKKHFSLDPIIGHPYGTSWELKNGGLVPVTEQAESHDIAGGIEEGGADNRAIVNDQMAQKLDRDDITDLKEQGKSGQEIIDQLIENSSTYNEKTVYSKAKYLKKKKNKHITKFVVLRPSTRILCEHFFLKAPSKHVQIRLDSLSQMLTAGNVQSGSKVMVFEHCQGLLTAAVMERLGGNGMVVQFHTEENPSYPALEAYNFPQQFRETLKLFNFKDVYSNFIKTAAGGRVQNGVNKDSASDPKNTSCSAGGSAEKQTGLAIEKSRLDSESAGVGQEALIPMDSSLSSGEAIEAETSGENPALEGSGMEASGSKDSPSKTLAEGSANPEIETGSVSMEVQEQDATSQVSGSRTLPSGEAEGSTAPPESSSPVETKQAITSQGAEELSVKDAGPLSPRSLKRKQRDEEKVERKRQKLEEFAKTREILLERNMDTLLIATKNHPAPVLLSLIDMLAWSRPFVVFSPYIETLKECYVKMRDRGEVIHLNLSETWYRDYQVLQDRTHPMVNMSSAGGYLLTGTVVSKE